MSSTHFKNIGILILLTILALLAPLSASAETEAITPVKTRPPVSQKTPPLQNRKEDADHPALTETTEARRERMKWWKDAKFGMFIHWGLYSGLAGDWKGKHKGAEWLQKNAELDTDTYAKEAQPLFSPKQGFAEEWATLAKEAGCQYAVLTSKHHEGFALFNSAETEFDAKNKQGRDLVKEYIDAFRAKGLKVGLYHSVIDWHHPSYDNTICPDMCYPAGQKKLHEDQKIPRDQEAYQKFLHAQVKELMSNYGKIDVIWWDYSQGDMSGQKGWKAPELIKMVRKLQPGIIMNSRLYTNSSLGDTPDTLDLRCGDFITPEQSIPKNNLTHVDWETCMTIGNQWGYTRDDNEIKSIDELVLKLAECTTKGGNLLLNINPQSDGTVPLAISMAMRNMGAWLKVNGEAVYGSTPETLPNLPEGIAATRKDNKIYLFILQSSELMRDKPLVIPLPEEYKKASLLGASSNISITPAGITLSPELLNGKTVPIIRLSK